MTLYTPIANTSGIQELITEALTEGLAKDQETLVLANVPAGEWVNFPASTTNPGRAIAGFIVADSSGNDITSSVETRQSGGAWQISSLVSLTNVQLKLEY
jgi:hypothetical protein